MATRYERAVPGPIGVIADDLTGACDTALQFLEPERAAYVLPALDPAARLPGGFAVAALNTESRHTSPALAARAVESAVRTLARTGCTRFYKKVDSTLRGNLAAEIHAALAATGAELAVVAPAFPEAGRLTVGGYQLVAGLPVSVSPYGRDPLAPATESHLPTLLAAGGGPRVGHLGLDVVMRGPEAIATALARAVASAERLVAVDACRFEDLAALARAIALTPYRVLPVGSAGLAQALRPHRLFGAPAPSGPWVAGGQAPVLVAAGSLNPVTLEQVRRLGPAVRLVPVDVETLLLSEDEGRDQLVARVLPLLLARQDVVLSTGSGPEALQRGTRLGRDLLMSAPQTGERIARALGRVVAALAASAPLSGLIVTGGETALGVCRALGGGPWRVARELLPAIPLLVGEPGGQPLRLVTKSGGFGSPEALAELVVLVKREAEASV